MNANPNIKTLMIFLVKASNFCQDIESNFSDRLGMILSRHRQTAYYHISISNSFNLFQTMLFC